MGLHCLQRPQAALRGSPVGSDGGDVQRRPPRPGLEASLLGGTPLGPQELAADHGGRHRGRRDPSFSGDLGREGPDTYLGSGGPATFIWSTAADPAAETWSATGDPAAEIQSAAGDPAAEVWSTTGDPTTELRSTAGDPAFGV